MKETQPLVFQPLTSPFDFLTVENEIIPLFSSFRNKNCIAMSPRYAAPPLSPRYEAAALRFLSLPGSSLRCSVTSKLRKFLLQIPILHDIMLPVRGLFRAPQRVSSQKEISMKKFAMLLPLIAGSCWGAGGIFVRTLKTAGFGNLSIMCSRSLVSFCILGSSTLAALKI